VISPMLVWPAVLLLTWIAGEYFERLRVPRMATYGVAGCLLGFFWSADPSSGIDDGFGWLADAAIGLVLCELGFRFSPAWLPSNPWVIGLSLLESIGTFLCVFLLCYSVGNEELLRAAILASLCVATSPVAILRVTRQSQSSGPITNLVLNLTAMNCIVGVLLFKGVTGVMIHSSQQVDWVYPGFMVTMVVASVMAAVMASIILHWLLRPLRMPSEVRAFAIALCVFLLTSFLHEWKLSPLVGAISFGIAMRHIGEKMTGVHQDFGSLGRFLTLFLIVFTSSRLDFYAIHEGLALGLLLGAGRLVVKVLSTWLLSNRIGITSKQGYLAGVALLPSSVFAICLLEQSKLMGVETIGSFPPLIVMLLIFEVLGPIGTSIAITLGGEAAEQDS
jgi:hypothetical protein